MRKRLPLFRLFRINYVLARHGLDRVMLSMPLFYPVRFLSYLNPWNWYRYPARSRGERIRRALEELGPIFVKFGQSLSTRPDLLPQDIADELAKLQDRVPPFPIEAIYRIIEEEYHSPVSELFQTFTQQPLAAASVAQVHLATLWDDKKVIVKVLRPGIEKIIRHDLDILYGFAKLAERYWSEGRRLKPVEVVAEFEQTILGELDLRREAANASQLRRNFAGSHLLYVPEIYWPYVRKRVLVMERIHGIPISDLNALRSQGVDLKQLSERGVEIFFTQVFRDCFFHADMHPGNIFVATENLHDPRYVAVDFGIMGSLNSSDQRYLAENLLAFFKRDYRRVAELHIESGWVSPTTRIDEFESDIRMVCEPMFEQPLKDISCGQMLLRLFQTARRFNMEVQPQLVLLQKTLLNIEGLGRQLYPELDLWSTAKPYLERWLQQQLSPKKLWEKIQEKGPYWIEKLPQLPDLIYDVLQQQKKNAVSDELRSVSRRQQKQKLQQAKKYSFWYGFGMAIVLMGLGTTIALLFLK